MSDDDFYAAMDDAMDEVPEELFRRIDNVVFDMEYEPTSDHRGGVGICGDPRFELLGLYRGVPLSRRNPQDYGYLNEPDRIWVFKNPILRLSRDENDLHEQIRRTLLHEIGHHFGMNDDELEAVGY